MGKNSHILAHKVRTRLVQYYCNFIDIILAFWAILGFEPARGAVLAPKYMQDKAIVVHLTPELQKAENVKLSQDFKSNGIGFFKGSAAMMQYWANYYKKYYTMTANEILSEDRSNVALHYQNIQKVLFQCDSASVDSDGVSYGTQGKLQINLYGGQSFKFTHSQWNDKSIRNILIRLFGEKLKYKK